MVKIYFPAPRFLLAGLLLVGLCACLKHPPGPPIVPAPQSGEIQDYLTARTGWLLAQSVALAQAPDARLVRIEGHWIDAGGSGNNWSYQFVSLANQQNLVIQAGQIQLMETLKQPPPRFINTDHWNCDSDAALTEFAFVQQLTYPITSMVLDADLIWHLMGPAGQGDVPANLSL